MFVLTVNDFRPNSIRKIIVDKGDVVSGFGFYEKYTMLRGNLRDRPDGTTPYK